MSMTVEQLAEEALALSSDSRALLADRIVESLDVGELSDLDRLWGAEAKRRRDEVREGRVETIPGEEAFLKVRRAVGRE
jgi:putative addiction module component (TIGR02574 family)